MQALSPGVWTGMKKASNENQIFTIVAFDQRSSYQRMLSDDVDYEEAMSIKSDVASALSPVASAFLLDPEYGIQPALQLHNNCGLLLALERSGYTGDTTYRHTEMYPSWHVSSIKFFGANAVKLLVYYNPNTGQLAEDIESLCRQVATQCNEFDIPLFLEPITYSLNASIDKKSAEFAKERPHLVQETAKRLGQVGAHVLKLEFPIDASFVDNVREWEEACSAISDTLSIPWVLLSAGVDFDIFARQVAVACQNGASGFLAGRAIWKECVSMEPSNRRQFLKESGIDRLKKLTSIANAYGVSWTNFFEAESVGEGWFKTYMKGTFEVS